MKLWENKEESYFNLILFQWR